MPTYTLLALGAGREPTAVVGHWLSICCLWGAARWAEEVKRSKGVSKSSDQTPGCPCFACGSCNAALDKAAIKCYFM